MMQENLITEQIIGAAIEVHRALGPGLLESAYEECLCQELSLQGLAFQRQVRYRLGIMVSNWIVVIAWISWLQAVS